ncbi:MAG: VOC family protein [Acidimicrobiales bacterium]
MSVPPRADRSPNDTVRIRQVALCTDDIWRDEKQLVAELDIAGVHRDPPNVFEMRNTVFAVGDTFLEILQPVADTAPSARFLAKHGGPGGYMLILQVGDRDAARERVDQMGVRVVYDAPPARHHGVEASALHLHPGDTGGTLISLDTMDPPEGWAWGGRAWQGHVHTGVVDGIVGAELRSADADALAERFGRLVGRAVGGDRTIELDGGVVRVVPGPDGSPDQLTAVEMHATDRGRAGETVVVSGTEIRLV